VKLFQRLARHPWQLPVLLLALTLLYPAGFRVNWNTSSQPKGLYHLNPRPGHAPRKHRLVLVTPPLEIARQGRRRGYLGAGELAKCVAALPGDTVEVTRQGLRVNGRLLPGTAPLARDSQGRPLSRYPRGPHDTLPGWVWLYSDHIPNSWDSRYFGPVPMASVRGALRPLLTFPPFPLDNHGEPTCAWHRKNF